MLISINLKNRKKEDNVNETRSYIHGEVSNQPGLADEEYRREIMEARLTLAEYRFEALQNGLLKKTDEATEVSRTPSEEEELGEN